MTATEELRRMLDERGVEWHDQSGLCEKVTGWVDSYGNWCFASTMTDTHFQMELNDLTPEQVIEATLGRERTCTMLRLTDCTCQYMHRYMCSECGEYNEQPTVMGESEPPRYCPSCGARVVEVGE